MTPPVPPLAAVLTSAHLRTGTTQGGTGDGDLPATVEPRRALPAAAAVLAAATIPVVALTAAAEIGDGYVYSDVVALLVAYAMAMIGLVRMPWRLLPTGWLTLLPAVQILFVASLTTMTGGGSSPYFALYAPVLAVAGWHLAMSGLLTTIALVAMTETWRAVVVDGDRGLDQLTIALPFFAALALVAHVTASRLTSAVVTIRRDQGHAAETLAAVRELSGDPGADPLPDLAVAARRIYGCTARTVMFDPPVPGAHALLEESDGSRRLSIAITGANSTYAVLEVERDRPFAANEARLLGVLAGVWGRAVDGARLFDQLRTASERDALTGLLNRRALELDVAGPMVADVDGRGVAVAFIDVDGTKRVNDDLGHEAGDLLIRTVARGLASAVREQDRVYRVGGDEFVVVAFGLGAEAARRLGERLCSVVPREARRGSDDTMRMAGLSVGVAVGHGPGLEWRRLLEAADRAMYRAKRRGGGGVEVVVSADDAEFPANDGVAAGSPSLTLAPEGA